MLFAKVIWGKGGIITISDASMWNSVVHETVKAHPHN